MVDSGASRSLLRREAYLDICKQQSRIPLIRKTAPLFSVSGAKLTTLGETEMEMHPGGAWPWTIVEGISHDAILGADILRKGESNINFKTEILTLGGTDYPLYCESKSDIAEISVVDPIFDIITEFDDIFYKKGTPLKECALRPLVIDTGDSAPVHQRPYRVPLAKRKILEKEVQEMLNLGVIRPSSGPWAAPLLLVEKKDQTWRCTVDYRALNLVTRMDRHPLPLIQDIFDQLGGSSVFTTVDLKAGYWQLPVHKDSIEKTSFVCHMGQYEFLREPMGIACSPPVFQREMQRALSGLVGMCVLVYLDDLVIYSKNMNDHADHLRLVFKRLRQFGLTLKREKCSFAQEEVELLGYVISENGIKANPNKVEAIINMPTPKCIKEVRSLLGMTGYYRQTIHQYAHTAEPLVALTRKHAKFNWGPEQQKAFELLKTALISNEVMAYPQVNRPYKLFTDACDYAVGAILVQEDDKGVERVVHYLSHQLSATQRTWAAIEKEAYGVVWAVKKLHSYLHGADTTVYTDHKPLRCLFTKQMNNTKVQRWAILLAEYGIKIEYIQGSRNIRADMLSRIRDHNEVCVIDTDDWIDADFPDGMESSRIPLEEDGLTEERLREEQRVQFPDLYNKAAEDDSEYEVIQGLLYSTQKPTRYEADYPRIVLPPCFRKQVIERAHKDVGHMGGLKTRRRVTEAYVWRGMKAEINKRVSLCPLCAVHVRRRQHVPMGEMPIATYPTQIVSADLIGPLAETPKGSKYILTILDHCTGWAEVYPLPDKKSETVTERIRDGYFARVGEPEIFLTDNGAEFNEREWRQYLRSVGVDHRTTTPVHPQGNGKSERFNRTIKEMLRKLINGQRTDWERKLPTAIRCYRKAVSTVTGFSPYHLWFGRRPRVPLSRMLHYEEGLSTPFGGRLAEMSEIFKQAKQLTEESRHYNRARLERKANAEDIEVGDTVIVAANEPMSLTAKWDHQFEVIRRVKTTYWLRNQVTGKEIKVHREKLRLVDPNLLWDEVAVRPRRQINRQVAPPLLVEPPVPVVQRCPATRPARRIVYQTQAQRTMTSHQVQPIPTGTEHEPMDVQECIHDTRLARRKRDRDALAPEEAAHKRQRIECVEFVKKWFHSCSNLSSA